MKLDKNKEYNIGDFKRHYPNWFGGDKKIIFMNYSEPLSDPTQTLVKTIFKVVKPTDIVLTTPLHIVYFEVVQPKKIHTFDISLQQILKVKINDSFKGKLRDYWWIDLYDAKMMSEALVDSKATVLYISNIIDWAESDEEIESFAHILQDSQLRLVIFSIFSLFDRRRQNNFIDLMKRVGWNYSEHKGNGSIHVLQRN